MSCASFLHPTQKGFKLGGTGGFDPRVYGTKRADSTVHSSCARYHRFQDGTQTLLDRGSQIIPELELGADYAKLCQVIGDCNVAYMDHDIQISALEHEIYSHGLSNDLPSDKKSVVNAILVLDEVQGVLQREPHSNQILGVFLLVALLRMGGHLSNPYFANGLVCAILDLKSEIWLFTTTGTVSQSS